VSEELKRYEQMLAEMGVDVSTEALANVPAPIISFAAGSFIGKFNTLFGYWFMSTEDDVLRREGGEEIPPPDIRTQVNEWFHYYYRSYDAANEAYDALIGESDFSPNPAWAFFAKTSDILVRDDRRENFVEAFGEMIVRHVLVKRLQKGSGKYPAKNRHQFQLISLPAAVAAQANTFGMPNPGFDVEILTLPEGDEEGQVTFTDELFATLCGDIEGDYQESSLWKQRVALWAALGETDGRKSAMIGSVTASGRKHSLVTTSDKLSYCLSVAQGRWTKPRWIKLASLHDPFPENVSSAGNRQTIPTIVEFYADEAAARAAYAEENPDAEVAQDGLPVPSNWAGAPLAQWLEELHKHDGEAPAVAAGALYCSPEEVIAWRENGQ